MAWSIFVILFNSIFFTVDGVLITDCSVYTDAPNDWSNNYAIVPFDIVSTNVVDSQSYAVLVRVPILSNDVKVRFSTCYPDNTIEVGLQVYDNQCSLLADATDQDAGCTFDIPAHSAQFAAGTLPQDYVYVLLYGSAEGHVTLTLTAGCSPSNATAFDSESYFQAPFSVFSTNMFFDYPNAKALKLDIQNPDLNVSFTTCSADDRYAYFDATMVIFNSACEEIAVASDAPECSVAQAGASFQGHLDAGIYYLVTYGANVPNGDFLLTLSSGCNPYLPSGWLGNKDMAMQISLTSEDMTFSLLYSKLYSFSVQDSTALLTITTCKENEAASIQMELRDAYCNKLTYNDQNLICGTNQAAATMVQTLSGGIYYLWLGNTVNNENVTFTLTFTVGCNPHVDTTFDGLQNMSISGTLLDSDIVFGHMFYKLHRFMLTDNSANLTFTTCGPNQTYPTRLELFNDMCQRILYDDVTTNCSTLEIAAGELEVGRNYYLGIFDATDYVSGQDIPSGLVPPTGGPYVVILASSGVVAAESPSPSPSESPSASPSKKPSPSASESPSLSPSLSASASPSDSPSPKASSSPSPKTIVNPSPSPAKTIVNPSPSPDTIQPVTDASPSPVSNGTNPGTQVVAYVIIAELERSVWTPALEWKYRWATQQALRLPMLSAVVVWYVVDGPSTVAEAFSQQQGHRHGHNHVALYTTITPVGMSVAALYAMLLQPKTQYQLLSSLRRAGFEGALFAVDPFITTLPWLPPLLPPVCKKRSYRHAYRCVLVCPQKGFFPSGLDCLPCDGTCGTCTGPYDTDCTSCFDQNKFLFNKQCVDSCPVGTFASGQKCVQCHDTCGTCAGPKDNHCRSCNYPRYRDENNRCVRSCAPNKYGRDSRRDCAPCHDSCSTCSGPYPTDCRSCKAKRYWHDNQCKIQCPVKTFPNLELGRCDSCHKSCKTGSCTGPYLKDCFVGRREDLDVNALAPTATSQSDGSSNSWIWIVVGVIVAVVVMAAVVAAVYIVWRRSHSTAFNDLVDANFGQKGTVASEMTNPTLASSAINTPSWAINGGAGPEHP